MQNRNPWIPVTPEKPGPSGDSHAEVLSNQMETTNWHELLGIYSGLLQDDTICNSYQTVSPLPIVDLNHKEQVHPDFDAANRLFGFNQGAANLRDDSLVWNVNPLSELSGTKNALYAPPANGPPMGRTLVVDKHMILQPDSRVESNWMMGHEDASLMLEQNHVLHSSQDISCYNLQHPPTASYWPSYNLNLPPRSEAGESSTAHGSFRLAPVTPDKQKHSKGYLLAGVPPLFIDKFSIPGKDKQENIHVSLPPEDASAKVTALPPLLIDKSLEKDKKKKNGKISHLCEDVNENHDEFLRNRDMSSAVITTSLQEKNITEDGNYGEIDLNKTPQQKPPKRRKHRPKVIVERKPKTTPKPAPANYNTSKGNPSGKRKYKPKKDFKTSSSTQPTDAKNKVKAVHLSSAAKSCRRMLNFEVENGVENESKDTAGGDQAETNNENKLPVNASSNTQDAEQYTGFHAASKTYEVKEGRLKEYSSEKHEILPQVSLPLASVVPSTTAKDHTLNVIARILNLRNAQINESGSQNQYKQVNQCISGGLAKLVNQNATKVNVDLRRQWMLQSRSQLLEDLHDITREQGSKGEHSNTQLTNPGTVKMGSKLLCHRGSKPGQHSSDSFKLWQNAETSKRKKIKGKFEGTSYSMSSTAKTVKDCSKQVEGRGNKQSKNAVNHITGEIQQQYALSQFHCSTDQIAQKNFHHITEAKSLSNLPVGSRNLEDPLQRHPISSKGNQSIASPVPLSLKKQTAAPALSSQAFSMDEVFKQQGKNVRGRQYSSKEPAGSQEKQRYIISVDEITNRLENLHIANNSKEIVGEEQNALVPYQGGGAIVPHIEFNHLRKHKPRPKVDLDPETNRLWNLLMGKESSESTETMDEDREKRWEGERNVFRGRVDSFIARMHLVQGDRRFSKWKGSVLDSVIGVFLTQNVSDHLSSSAYMSLAAKFPLQPTTIKQTYCQNDGSQFVGRQVQINRPGQNKCYDQRMIRHPRCNFSCIKPRKSSERWTEKDKTITTSISAHLQDQRKEENVMSSQSSVGSFFSEVIDSEYNDQIFGCNFGKEYIPNSFQQAETIAGFQDYQHPLIGSSFLNKRPMLGNQQLENHLTNGQNLNLDSGSLQNAYPITDNTIHSQTLVSLSSDYQFSTTTGLEEWEARFLGLSGKEIPANSAGHAQDGIAPIAESSLIESRVDHTVANMQQEQQISLPVGFQTTKSQGSINFNQEKRGEPVNPGSIFMIEPKRRADALSKRTSGNEHQVSSSTEPSNHIGPKTSSIRKRKVEKEKTEAFNWDSLRKQVDSKIGQKERSEETMDSLDYEALRNADVREISETIKERGMNNMLAERIKDFLDRLVREHGRIDLEWLRYVPPDKSKDYLLSIRGLGLKSVECVRLLTLHHLAFPVDTNVGRIAVRLGWVPLQPLPESLQLHLLEMYPVLESIQKYLWPRLCNLDQKTLYFTCSEYELHYQMITFGKVFCTKREPNCNACPMRGECRHFASAFASARLALPGPEEGRIVSSPAPATADKNSGIKLKPMLLPSLEDNFNRGAGLSMGYCEPIIEEPTTPEQFTEVSEADIEDAFYEDPDAIPTIKLNIEQFTENLQSFMQEHNMEMENADMSKALVALSPELASIPMPKLKNVIDCGQSTKYELPDSHPLSIGLDRRELDDPSPYLLAIWTPGETADSIQPPESKCNSQCNSQGSCDKQTCISCNSSREAQSQTVRGTLLIPCRTAMRGSFPLNGTYFQVNEVFADHESSLVPINVPRNLLWKLPRRTVFFGTSVSTIFKGLSAEGIQYCFWKGFVCVRGFDRKARAPRPLMARLHFPASKLTKKSEQKIKGSSSEERNQNRKDGGPR